MLISYPCSALCICSQSDNLHQLDVISLVSFDVHLIFSALLGCVRGDSLEYVRLDVIPSLESQDIAVVCGNSATSIVELPQMQQTNNYYMSTMQGI